MRRHRTQSESVERGRFLRFEEGWYPVYSETEWGRDCLSCWYMKAICSITSYDIDVPMFILQDLGNTNFSIHLPRASFDRKVTAQIVLRAVRSLGIDAHLNDRNDICVGKDKMSSNTFPVVVEELTS